MSWKYGLSMMSDAIKLPLEFFFKTLLLNFAIAVTFTQWSWHCRGKIRYRSR
jgi:hypothetical protein